MTIDQAIEKWEKAIDTEQGFIDLAKSRGHDPMHHALRKYKIEHFVTDLKAIKKNYE